MNKINYRNLFYMLCYATKYLNKLEFADADVEDVQGTHDMLAYLLCKAFELLIKNGYIKEYDIVEVITDHPDGEIDIQKSMELGVYAEGKLVCKQNKLVIDNIYNQYIKAAINLLLTMSNSLVDVDKQSKTFNSNIIRKLKSYRNILSKVSHLTDFEHYNIDIESAKEHYKPVLEISNIIFKQYIIWSKYKDVNRNNMEDKKKSLFDINDPSALCYIFEEFGRKFYYTEYRDKAKGSRPSYKVYDRSNELDLLLISNKENLANIVDFKWYGDVNTGRIDIERQLLDYSISFRENHKKEYNIFTTAIMAVDTMDLSRKISNRKKYFDRDRYGVKVKMAIRYVNVNDTFESIKQQLINIADEVFK